MAKAEKELENKLRLEMSRNGHRLVRANAGQAWAGAGLKHEGKTITLKNPRIFHGLPKGCPDLCGFSTIEVTPEMVGKKLPVFTALELKTETVAVTKDQKRVMAGIKRAGGITGVARNCKQGMEIINEWKARIKRGHCKEQP